MIFLLHWPALTMSKGVGVINKRVKVIILVSALMLASCSSSGDYVVISKPFGLCAPRSMGVSYNLKSGIDVQAGTIEQGSTKIDIYITLYPDISFSKRERAKLQPGEFRFFFESSKKNGEETRIYTFKKFNEPIFVELNYHKDDVRQVVLVHKIESAFFVCSN